MIRIRLTARRPVGDCLVGVVRAAMDEELGVPLAELHVAQPDREAERLVVREGQHVMLGGAAHLVDSIWPWNRRTPAGVVLRPVPGGGAIGDGIG